MSQSSGALFVPLFLLDEAGADGTFGHAVVIAPHWDGVVDLIGPVGAGYPAALQLLDRLERQVNAQEGRLRDAATLELDGRLVGLVLVSEADGDDASFPGLPGTQRGAAHGAGATLRDSLGWPPETPGEPAPLWGWTAVPADKRGAPSRYRLALTCAALGNGDRTLPDSLALFDPSLTWDEALRRIGIATQNAGTESTPTREDEVVWFRQSVVAAVVREFELLGLVGHFDTHAHPGGWAPRPDDVEIAVRAYDLVQSLPHIYVNRTKVVLALAHEPGLSERKVRDALTRLGAYRAGGGRGGDGPESHRAKFDHFMRVIRQVWQAADQGGSVNQRIE